MGRKRKLGRVLAILLTLAMVLTANGISDMAVWASETNTQTEQDVNVNLPDENDEQKTTDNKLPDEDIVEEDTVAPEGGILKGDNVTLEGGTSKGDTATSEDGISTGDNATSEGDASKCETTTPVGDAPTDSNTVLADDADTEASANQSMRLASDDETVSRVNNAEELVAAIKENAVIELLGDIKVDEELYILDTPNVTINGNGHIITASENFKTNTEGQNHLVKIQSNNVTLNKVILETTSANVHALDIWGAKNVVLNDVTLNHANASTGAPLVVNGSDVTVKGKLDIVAGENSWYGINVDVNGGSPLLNFEPSATLSYNYPEGKVVIYVQNAAADVVKNSGLAVVSVNGNYVFVSEEQAEVTCVAKTDDTYYSTLQEAVDVVESGATIQLLKDIELDAPVNLKKTVTICGSKENQSGTKGEGCYKVSIKNEKGTRAFNLDGSSGLDDNAVVTFRNIQIEGPLTPHGNTRGISIYKTKGLKLNLENVYLAATCYALNIASENTETSVDVKNSKLEGWCAFQLWSPATVTVEESELLGTNKYTPDRQYSFATIVVNQCSVASKITIQKSIIKAESDDSKDTLQEVLSIQNINNNGAQAYPSGNQIIINNCSIMVNGTYKDDNGKDVELEPLYYAEGNNTIEIDGYSYFVPAYEDLIYDVLDATVSIERAGKHVVYGSLETAFDDAQNNEIIMLLKETEFNNTINLNSSKSIKIDLAGHTASYKGTAQYALEITNGSALEILDSSADKAGKLTAPQRGIKVGAGAEDTGATLLLNGGTIQSGDAGEDAAVAVYANNSTTDREKTIPCKVKINHATLKGAVYVFGKGAELTVNDGALIESAGDYAISGNGTSKNCGTTINITGGTIKQTATAGGAIYHPQAGTLNISGNADIEGDSGIQLCSGGGIVANITGGTITATGTDKRAEKTGDGFISDGAALSIVDRDYPGGAPKMTVSGGTFISKKSSAVLAYTWSENKATTWGKASEFVSISGGNYSSAPDTAIIASGYAVTAGTDYPYKVVLKADLGFGDSNVSVAPADPVVDKTIPDIPENAEPGLKDLVEALDEYNVSFSGATAEATEAEKELSNGTLFVENVFGTKVEVNADKAATLLNSQPGISGVTADSVHFFLQPNLKVTVKEGTTATELKLDISMEMNVIASKESDKDAIVLQGDGVNAVVYGSYNIEKPADPYVDITIPVSNEFYQIATHAKHVKEDGTTYYYELTKNGDNTVTFRNPHGFSAFSILADSRTTTISYEGITGSVTYNVTDINTTSLPTASKPGYTFKGWSIEGRSDLGTVSGLLTDALLNALAGRSVTATAVFEAIPTTGSGSGSNSSNTETKAESATLVQTIVATGTKPVSTGDSANTLGYVALILVAGAAFTILYFKKKKA